MQDILKIWEAIKDQPLLSLRLLAGLFVIHFLVKDLFKFNLFKWKKIKKADSITATNYIGILLIVVFVIWPLIDEASIGNMSFKKSIEDRVENVEKQVQDILGRKVKEYWMLEDFEKFSYQKKGEFYHYEIPLKYKPINNSVELWLSSEAQNPTYYTVNYNEKKVIYRNSGDMESIKSYIGNREPAITVRYLVEIEK